MSQKWNEFEDAIIRHEKAEPPANPVDCMVSCDFSEERKVGLASRGCEVITTVGELRDLLQPFADECPITSLKFFYVPVGDGARLQIELST